ncbi:unnamed protein product [Camellia sinensis]
MSLLSAILICDLLDDCSDSADLISKVKMTWQIAVLLDVQAARCHSSLNCIPSVTVDVVRGYLHKSLSATVEFIIESEKASLPDQPVSPELVIFYVTQDTQRHSLLPELRSGVG